MPNAKLITMRKPKSYRILTRGKWRLTSSKEVVFVTQVLSTICLTEDGNSSRVQSSRLSSAARSNTKAQRSIVHVVDNNALVLGAVVRPAANVSLDDVSSVQERQFSVALDPDFPSGVLGDDRKRGDVQTKFAALGELACVFVRNGLRCSN